MQEAEVVLSVLRERGRKGLPCEQLYRQMFNRDLYLLAYGNIYSNKGAMTPGASEETADGMSDEKIEQITGLMRRESYRFSPARRVYIPKKNGRLRPLGMPSRSDKLVGEVIRLLLEAYYEPRFSERSHGRLSFPAGILNFESSCGVCDSWGWARVGRRDCGWSGDDGCLLGEAGDRGLVGAVCLAQR